MGYELVILKDEERLADLAPRPTCQTDDHGKPKSPSNNVGIFHVVVTSHTKISTVVHVDDEMSFINIFDKVFVEQASFKFTYAIK